MTDITVPQLGESVTEATVGSWQVKTGDAVSRDDVLVELETDKVAVEVRAEEDGVMGEISAQEGDTVEIGAKLGVLDAGGKAATRGGDKDSAKAEEKPAESDAGKKAAKPKSDDKPADGGKGSRVQLEVMEVGRQTPQSGDTIMGAPLARRSELLRLLRDRGAV